MSDPLDDAIAQTMEHIEYALIAQERNELRAALQAAEARIAELETALRTLEQWDMLHPPP